MITDRTTEEDNPVRKANAHKKRITRKNPKGLKAVHRFHKKEKKNKNKVYNFNIKFTISKTPDFFTFNIIFSSIFPP